MKAELQQLVALQNLDTSIRKLQLELEAIPTRRAEIEAEFDQRAFEIRALETARDDARHSRTQLEIEVSEQKTRAERAERNLMSSKKQDEYTAAIREADAARKQICDAGNTNTGKDGSPRKGRSLARRTRRGSRFFKL